MAGEPGGQMLPMSLVDFTAIDSGIPSPPHVLSVYGPDLLANWDSSDMDAYREKRGRWQDAILRYLDSLYPGLSQAVVPPTPPRHAQKRVEGGEQRASHRDASRRMKRQDISSY